jgi:hypothetical protein
MRMSILGHYYAVVRSQDDARIALKTLGIETREVREKTLAKGDEPS